jgi:alpha-ketoglutarate-dependent taurine dioxygenase
VTDLRRVWADLPAPLRAKLESSGLKYARVHGSPSERSPFRLWTGRRWSDVFETHDRAEVEKAARAQELELIWLADGSVRLQNTLPAFRVHPLYGTTAWHNQAQLFHPQGPALEYEHIAAYQRTLRASAVELVVKAASVFRRWSTPQDHYDLNVSYGDGTPISRQELQQMVDTIWRNLACFRWMPGDLLVLDNFSVSHGRLPFRGARRILVALTDGYPN